MQGLETFLCQLDVAPILQLDLWFLQFLRKKNGGISVHWEFTSDSSRGYTRMGRNSSQSIVSFWMKVPQPSNDMSSGWIFHREIVPKYTCEVLIKVSAEKWDFVQKEIPCLQKIIMFLRVPCGWCNLVLGFQTLFLHFIFYPYKDHPIWRVHAHMICKSVSAMKNYPPTDTFWFIHIKGWSQ